MFVLRGLSVNSNSFVLFTISFLANCYQWVGDHQQPDPGEEVRLWGVWRPAGRLSGMLGHIRSVTFIVWPVIKREALTRANWSIVLLVDLSSSPPGPYGQEQYICRPEQHLKAPPILPPHLLQVILNKDTNISVSVFSMSTANISSCLDLSFWQDPLISVWSCPAAWTQSRHAQPPLCSLHKGKAQY